MTWLLILTIGGAGFGCGLVAKGPLAAAWWRSRTIIAEACVTALEGELAASRQTLATVQGVHLTRLKRCEGCATCNPAPAGFDLPDYEFGDRP